MSPQRKDTRPSKAVSYKQVYLSLRFNTVLFPFDSREFIHALPDLGFVLTDRQLPPAPFGGRVEVTGLVARRAEIGIRLEPEKQIVGVVAAHPLTAVDAIEQVESVLRDALRLDLGRITMFYELLASATVEARKSPLEVWPRQFRQVPIIERLSSSLGPDLCVFGVRLAARGTEPNSPDWFDIEVGPMILAPHRLHNVNVVFRRRDRGEVEDFARRLDETVAGLIAAAEEE